MSDEPLEQLRERLRAFARERDWERFHTPKNLSTAVAAEAGELAAVLQWARPDEDLASYRAELADEAADVMIYLVRLCDVVGIDLLEAVDLKMTENARRFRPPAPRT